MLLIKLKLDPSNASVAQRISGSIWAVKYFFTDMNILQWFVGSGPGNNSLISELEIGPGSLSWILSVFVDLGLFGLLSLGYLVYKLLILAKSMPIEVQPFYFISLSTLLIHLLTMTGFYLPVLPLIFSLPLIFKYIERTASQSI